MDLLQHAVTVAEEVEEPSSEAGDACHKHVDTIDAHDNEENENSVEIVKSDDNLVTATSNRTTEPLNVNTSMEGVPPTYTTLTPVRSSPLKTEVDDRMEVAQIMESLKQGWDGTTNMPSDAVTAPTVASPVKHTNTEPTTERTTTPADAQPPTSSSTTETTMNQLTIDISEQVAQLPCWQQRALQVTLRLPSPQSVTVTIPAAILSPCHAPVESPPSPLSPPEHNEVMNGIGVAEASTGMDEGEEEDMDVSEERHRVIGDDGSRMWQCHLCEEGTKVFVKKYSLKMHFMNVHGSQRLHDCELCGKKFFQLQHLQTHRQLHENEKPFECEICHQRFTQKSHLLRHAMRIHERLPDVGSRTPSSPREQFIDQTTGEMKPMPEHHVLGQPIDVRRLGGPRQHRPQSHNPNHSNGQRNLDRHPCKYCDRSFPRVDYLRDHVTLVHSQHVDDLGSLADTARVSHTAAKKPHACELCPLSFARPKRLHQHEWMVHKVGDSSSMSPVTRFPCDKCGTTFTRTANLRRHQLAVCKK